MEYDSLEYKIIMDSLRMLYLERNFSEMKRKYLMCRWMLNKVDRDNIEGVLFIPTHKEPGEQTILELAQNIIGGTITKIK